MKHLKYIYVLIALKLILSLIICLFYLLLDDKQLIIKVPRYILILILAYTVIQFFSWQLYPKQSVIKYKRFYYIGLTSICISIFFADKVNHTYLIILVKSCSWLLFISVLSEIHRIYKFKK